MGGPVQLNAVLMPIILILLRRHIRFKRSNTGSCGLVTSSVSVYRALIKFSIAILVALFHTPLFSAVVDISTGRPIWTDFRHDVTVTFEYSCWAKENLITADVFCSIGGPGIEMDYQHPDFFTNTSGRVTGTSKYGNLVRAWVNGVEIPGGYDANHRLYSALEKQASSTGSAELEYAVKLSSDGNCVHIHGCPAVWSSRNKMVLHDFQKTTGEKILREKAEAQSAATSHTVARVFLMLIILTGVAAFAYLAVKIGTKMNSRLRLRSDEAVFKKAYLEEVGRSAARKDPEQGKRQPPSAQSIRDRAVAALQNGDEKTAKALLELLDDYPEDQSTIKH